MRHQPLAALFIRHDEEAVEPDHAFLLEGHHVFHRAFVRR